MSNGGNIEAIYPVTPTQDGMLFHVLYGEGAPLYLQQYTCLIEGRLDAAAFARAWHHVVARHAALRTLITWKGRDRPLQVVLREVEVPWEHQDWRAVPASEQEAALETWLEEDRRRGVDLDAAPLLRFALLSMADDAHRFVFTHHHVILDGWSLGIVLREAFTLYQDFVAGRPASLDAPVPIREFVRWLQERDHTGAQAFWQGRLAGFDEPTELPIADERADRWASRQRSIVTTFGEQATATISEALRGRGLTLSTLLRGAWSLVLGRYTRSDDVVFGATVAGRPAELDGALDMVGLFINSVPVRVRIPDAGAVATWLETLQRDQIATSPHEATPLRDVQAWSGVDGGSPLFDTLLVLENVPADLPSGSLGVSEVRYLQSSNYPVAILVMPGKNLEIVLLYDEDRFERDIVERIGRQLFHTVVELASALDGDLSDIDVMSDDEQHEIVNEWNDTDRPFPADRTIHGLVFDVAAAHPERTAVAGAETTLSYRELETRAQRIARRLADAGVGPGDRVAVVLERCPGFVVAAVGVLASGAAYVPIDPGLPAERIGFMLEDTSAAAILTGHGHATRPSVLTLEVDPASGVLRDPHEDLGARTSADPVTADDDAYVLYTSGSTGRPKGVVVTHRNLVASTTARLDVYDGPVGTFLLLSPFIFDSSVAGLFSTLTQGGTLVLPEPRMEQDVRHLAGLIDRHRVTHTLMLPVLYGLLLDAADAEALRSLDTVMVAGEACPPSLVATHHRVLPGVRLVNEYGPTEATVWCTFHVIPPPSVDDPARVPIGRPIPNARVHVLDPSGRVVPVGVPGELHVGGAGVARGYLNRPELTAAAFVERDVARRGVTRLYRTGDLARYRADGTIDLLGRMDHQVKVRGQRIELGEIESAMRDIEEIRNAAVIVRDGDAGRATLAAFVEPLVDAGRILQRLREQLPAAMVPATVVAMDRLPRGPTGKIDRLGLEKIEVAAAAPTEYVPPRTETEERLAEIWATVLGVDRVGATDDFFALGGDSIASIRIIARAHALGLEITPRQFFAAPTVAALAAGESAS
jgi:amino acid adenylation domain-containing protein